MEFLILMLDKQGNIIRMKKEYSSMNRAHAMAHRYVEKHDYVPCFSTIATGISRFDYAVTTEIGELLHYGKKFLEENNNG